LKTKQIIALFCIVSIAPMLAMEDKQKNKNIPLTKKKSDPEKREFLMYPEDAIIDEKSLPKGVENLLGNIFLVPEGFDATLIHKTLVPKRIPDFEVSLTQ